MAILKHIAMKNINFTESIQYLLFDHDDFTQELVLDEYGVPVMREDYYFDGINCEPYAYDFECEDVNRSFHKNMGYDEIKQHHYILSFDPKDVTECGLTGERAQALAMEFARDNFPGHQILVCTHLDGHNHSGNIHAHIILNSLRKDTVERRPFMEREIDCKAGYKHHLTPKLLVHLKQEVMNLCNREKLHQVDLLHPAKDRITSRERYAQMRKNEQTAEITKEHIPPTPKDANSPNEQSPTKVKKDSHYDSVKDQLRHAIADAARNAKSETEFAGILSRKYNITLKVSRGRYAYLIPERQKPIRGRMLGTDYEEKHLRARFKVNQKSPVLSPAPTATEAWHSLPTSSPAASKEPSQVASNVPSQTASKTPLPTASWDMILPSILKTESNLRLVSDLQHNLKAQASYAYARKVRLGNLQKMADTVSYVQQQGFDSLEAVETKYQNLLDKQRSVRALLDLTNGKLKDTNEQIHYTGQYLANKAVYRQYLKSGKSESFRKQNYDAVVKFETARDYLKKKNGSQKAPSLSALKEQKAVLLENREKIQKKYALSKKSLKDFRVVKQNIEYILDLPNRQDLMEQRLLKGSPSKQNPGHNKKPSR